MKTLIGSWCLLGLAVAVQAETPDPELRFQVLVYNYAGVNDETLASAEQQVERIYRRVGLGVEWLHCPLTPEETHRRPVCELPGSPTRFYLRLLSSTMTQGLPSGRDIFGFALLPEKGDFGVTVNVCADRARDMADRTELMHGLILGHLMSHELGHLLLGTAAHPASGIMRIPWRTQELVRIKQEVMFFLPEQAERIRTQMLARIASQRATQPILLSSK